VLETKYNGESDSIFFVVLEINNMEPFQQAPLPWATDALEPKGISKETIAFHYGKHHAGYVKKLNALCKAQPVLARMTLEEIIKNQGGGFNLAAQIYNHTFYWRCLCPNGGGVPRGLVADQIKKDFGSFDDFKTAFTAAAASHFGSGWVWLAYNKTTEKLMIMGGHDAHTPLENGYVPVLTCDVWEHAYYIDFRNNRGGYIKAFWNLVNWGFVNKTFVVAISPASRL
jgi:Fe-Mn family superoxide dismutase